MIVGGDWGNDHVKLCTPNGVQKFPSDIISYRDIKVENDLRIYDFIFEYGNRKGLAGTLARDEKNDLDRSRRGDTKLHEDALIRILIAIHQFTDTRIKLVVGQPIKQHSRDKERIKDMLLGTHRITVNGLEKTITIEDVLVAVEGGSALFSNPKRGKVHLIDIGSGTINFATSKNNRFINSESDTIPKGIENLDHNYEAIAQNIQNVAIDLGWKENEPTYLVGGGAPLLKEYLPYPVFNPMFDGKLYPPEVANAIGFYKIGEQVWQKK